MYRQLRPLMTQAYSCWNWKCALLSATARSLVYLAAMRRNGLHGSLVVILVEVGYVTLTAGFYAGLQQRALGLRSRFMGNLVVVLVVPGLSQVMDWIAHLAMGAEAPGRATLAVSIFAGISALFHLHVMRNGVFLTGQGRSLLDDFSRVPRLVAGFVCRPLFFFATLTSRLIPTIE